jgi:hypothetical protein
LLDELVIARVGPAADGLQPAGAIDVRDGWNHVSLVLVHVDDVEHKTGGIVTYRLGQAEKYGRLLFQDRWGKGMKGFTEFNLRIDDILHLGAA